MGEINLESGDGISMFSDIKERKQYELLKDVCLHTIVNVIVDCLDIKHGKITLQSHIVDDLGADSLDCVEMLMNLEKELNIVIPDDEAEKLETVGDVFSCLVNKFQIKEKTEKEESLTQDETEEEIKQYEILKNVRTLTTIRRFKAKETFQISFLLIAECLKDDVFEEIFDKPNYFFNVSKYKREALLGKGVNDKSPIEHTYMSLTYINQKIKEGAHVKFPFSVAPERILHRQMQQELLKKEALLNLELIEPINVLESEQLEYKIKKTSSKYKSKLKQLAKLNEDLTYMKYILQIKD